MYGHPHLFSRAARVFFFVGGHSPSRKIWTMKVNTRILARLQQSCTCALFFGAHGLRPYSNISKHKHLLYLEHKRHGTVFAPFLTLKK